MANVEPYALREQMNARDRPTSRRAGTLIVALMMLGTTLVGLQPTLAESPEQIIGSYNRFGVRSDLTDDHVSWTSDGNLKVTAPLFANQIQVNATWLEDLLGEWSSNEPFTIQAGKIMVDSREGRFSPLDLGEQQVFTRGGMDQVRFLERPMWVSVHQVEHGQRITLDVDDGDTTGQQIYISKQWLWEKGIHRPVARHEDGTLLAVTQSEDHRGYILDVHHFSLVFIDPDDRLIKGGPEGESVFLGHVWWDPEEKRLEIDVLAMSEDRHKIRVDKDWVDMNLTAPALQERSWQVVEFEDVHYYETIVTKEEAPTTLVYSFFEISSIPQYTEGSYTSLRYFAPLFVSGQVQNGLLEVAHEVPAGRYVPPVINMNVTWLEEHGITKPNTTFNGEAPTSHSISGNGIVQYQLAGDLMPGAMSMTVAHSESMLSRLVDRLQTGSKCEAALRDDDGNLPIHITNLDGDHTGSYYSKAKLYLMQTTFCFEWDLVRGPSGDAVDFLLRYEIYDPQTRDSCTGGTASENGPAVSLDETVDWRDGYGICEWRHSDDLPGDIRAEFIARSIYEWADESGWKSWVFPAAECASSAIGAAAAIKVARGAVKLAKMKKAAAGATVVGAVVPCGAMILKLGEQLEIQKHGRYRDEQIITQNFDIDLPDVVFVVDILDPGDRRLDTWNLIEEVMAEANLDRPDEWDGTQTVYWRVKNVKGNDQTHGAGPQTVYDADLSSVKDFTTSSSKIKAQQIDGHSIRISTELTEFEEETLMVDLAGNDGIDWETPSGPCMLEKKIESVVAGVTEDMTIRSDVSVPSVCDMSEFGLLFVPPVDHPDYPDGPEIAPIYQENPDLPKPLDVNDTWIKFRATSGYLGLDNHSFSITQWDAATEESVLLAMVKAVTTNQTFLDGIDKITIKGALMPDPKDLVVLPLRDDDCKVHEQPYESNFRATIIGDSMVGAKTLKDWIEKPTMICFDFLPLVSHTFVGVEVEHEYKRLADTYWQV